MTKWQGFNGTTFKTKNTKRRQPRRKRRAIKAAGSVTKNKYGQSVITYRPAQNKIPFADRFNTRMYTQFVGTGGGLPAGVNSFVVALDGCFHPFDLTTLSGYGALLPVSAFFTPAPGSAIATTTPYGYTNLVNPSVYLEYRVKRSTINVKVILPGKYTPSASGEDYDNVDQLECVIVPVTDGVPGTVLSALHMSDWLRQPFAKKGTFRPIGGSKSVTNSITPGTLFGKPEIAFECSIDGTHSGFYNGNPASPAAWLVLLETVNGVAIEGTISIMINLTHDVECYNISPLIENTG